jgi:UDP-N-acetylglucosamine 3-dehydrogenase
MGKTVNLALIGSGYWGTKLANEYISLHKSNDKFKFLGIIDSDKQKLQQVSARFGLPSKMLFSKVEEGFKIPDLNAVHIATPSETHYDLASLGVSLNKHVLLEKPMAMNARDAFRLARSAEKNGSVLLVGHIFRFSSALTKAKEIIEAGDIGCVKHITFSWLDFLNPLPNRDIIFDLLPHPIDILNFMTEEWPVSIFALSNRSSNSQAGAENEEVALVTLIMPDNKVVQIALSWAQIGIKERKIVITGTDASMEIDTISQSIVIHRPSQKVAIGTDRNNTMKTMMEHFINCISERHNPNNSSLVGAMTVNILSAARKSFEERRMVNILE